MEFEQSDERHGSYNGYANLGCRCPRCTEANRVNQVDYLVRHPEQREKNRLRTRRWRASKKLELPGEV